MSRINATLTLIDQLSQRILLPLVGKSRGCGKEARSLMRSALEEGLTKICACPVVGRDVLQKDPSIFWKLNGFPLCWIIEPLSGYQEFEDGHDTWGIIVALVSYGRPVATWVIHPARQGYIVAHQESCYVDGQLIELKPGFTERVRILTASKNFYAREQEKIKYARRPGFDIRSQTNTSFSIRRLAEGSIDGYLTSVVVPWSAAASVFIWKCLGGFVCKIDQSTWRLSDTEGALLFALNHDEWKRLHYQILEGYDGPTHPSFSLG